MHCLECLSDYFFVYGENNCYKTEELLPNKKYYFSNSDNKFHKCYYTCSECSNNEPSEEVHYCEKCADDHYFLSGTTNCYDINYTENGYYLSNITIMNVTEPKFQKCYQRCKTCFGDVESNSETKEVNHNCKECAENYYKLDNGSFPNNCYDKETINAWKKIEQSNINTWKNSEIEENEINEETSIIGNSVDLEEVQEEVKASEEEKEKEKENPIEIENTTYKEDYIEKEEEEEKENLIEIENTVNKEDLIEEENPIEIENSIYKEDYIEEEKENPIEIEITVYKEDYIQEEEESIIEYNEDI